MMLKYQSKLLPQTITLTTMKKILLILGFICVISFSANASANSLNSASDDSLTLNLNADLVSRYVWRGMLVSGNPNIQPYASISYKGLTFGAWGSFGLSTPFAETDLYLSYSVGPITLTVNDYYAADSVENFSYFNFKKKETLHALEGQITYTGPESFPISLTAATFFAGADDSDSDGENDYSTYLEVAYTSEISGLPLKLFVGGTAGKGIYSDKANIVNVGATITKNLKISNSYELPIFGSLSVNPYTEDMFFVFGITF